MIDGKKAINRFIIFLLVALVSCHDNKRDFFQNMNPGFKDVKTKDGFYFIKSFGLSKSPHMINGVNYWKLSNDDLSSFSLKGYLRKINDSIMYLPIINNQIVKEQKLFQLMNGSSNWRIYTGKTSNSMMGDSIVLSNVYKAKDDIIYKFNLFAFIEYKGKRRYHDPVFSIEISRLNGFISIAQLDPARSNVDYKVNLYPVQKFVQRQTNMLSL